MTTPVEASHHPGPPGILWAPSLTDIAMVHPTGFAAWHRHWNVWVRLEPGDAYGIHPPVDGILLAPESPSDGAPDLAGRVAHLETQLETAITELRRARPA